MKTLTDTIKEIHADQEARRSQIVVTRIVTEFGDEWYGTTVAVHSDGGRWELQGHGKTPGEAADAVYQASQKDEKDWYKCGCEMPQYMWDEG